MLLVPTDPCPKINFRVFLSTYPVQLNVKLNFVIEVLNYSLTTPPQIRQVVHIHGLPTKSGKRREAQ
ncbi:hypothetical protein BD293_0453 [Roseinatronobacter monicus]|uniref:Uncharacterized protein n=1 Tax=Roseinatronobacter monicus TaxID=393481 RepID=A0A543K9Z2_9RHOB|nr:hypothetical protein BD293_0453 [Roseinatronobacter monicus]